VAIVGAGGIGFDIATFLTQDPKESLDARAYARAWGVDCDYASRGGLATAVPHPATREVWLMQRKATRVGAGLARTTGWIHRRGLKRHGVQMLAGVEYRRIDASGIEIAVDGKVRHLAVDTVVVCAGQEPQVELLAPLAAAGLEVHAIGGAALAAELDAERAIREGTELGLSL
jgi:2,4-dienoyl-CoA reductase (NADPH2)